LRVCHSALDVESITAKDLVTNAIYCYINTISAKVLIKNDAVIKVITRSYTDPSSAADGDEVYPDKANLISGFEKLRYNKVL
jgi:hypothetical protein